LIVLRKNGAIAKRKISNSGSLIRELERAILTGGLSTDPGQKSWEFFFNILWDVFMCIDGCVRVGGILSIRFGKSNGLGW
jgi:hypothetical protein